jgi:hypothetical protein
VAELHELAALERFNIFSRQFKPFTITTLGFEPLVPIALNTTWIIGLDLVDYVSLFWKLDR